MVYKDSAGKEIHEGDSLMDLTPGFVGEILEVFLDEDEGELAVNQDGTPSSYVPTHFCFLVHLSYLRNYL